MSQWDKLIQKLNNTPTEMWFSERKKILEPQGDTLKENKEKYVIKDIVDAWIESQSSPSQLGSKV